MYGLKVDKVVFSKYILCDYLQIFRENITKCLLAADKLRAESIAFPSIGCGFLSYYPRVVGELLTEQVLKYKADYKNSTIKVPLFFIYNCQ